MLLFCFLKKPKKQRNSQSLTVLNVAEESRKKMTEGEKCFAYHYQSVIGNPNGDNPTLETRWIYESVSIQSFYYLPYLLPISIPIIELYIFFRFIFAQFNIFLNSDLLRIFFGYQHAERSHNFTLDKEIFITG